MASETPVVRYLVACDEVLVAEGGKYSLRNLLYAIAQVEGESFPCIRERMTLFGLLTNARGKHSLAIELAVLDKGFERSLKVSGTFERDFRQDPLSIHALPIPLKNVLFRRPGQYTFYLICDGKRIAHEYVEVR